MAEHEVLLGTGAPPPVNASELAPVATTGSYASLYSVPTKLSQFNNDLTGSQGDFTVPGKLALTTGTVTCSAPLSIANGLSTGNLSCSALACGSNLSCAAGATFATTVLVSGSLTTGSVIKAQGVQIPRTTFGTASAGTVSLNPSCSNSASLTVAYGVTYSNTPAVSVGAQGAGWPLLVTAEAISKTGFSAVLYNASAGTYTGAPNIAWQASASG